MVCVRAVLYLNRVSPESKRNEQALISTEFSEFPQDKALVYQAASRHSLE